MKTARVTCTFRPSKDYIDDITPVLAPWYARIVTFSHLPVTKCLTNGSEPFDIAVIGAPFDTGMSYRPGAPFGPPGIREGSRRQFIEAYDPYRNSFGEKEYWAKVVECGDIAMSPFDNRIALDQLLRGHWASLKHDTTTADVEQAAPRLLTLGGDHTITFAAIRAAHEIYSKITVLHFDSHIDTWDPAAVGGNLSSYGELNHGTFLHYAHELGYLDDDGNMHVGIRAPWV